MVIVEVDQSAVLEEVVFGAGRGKGAAEREGWEQFLVELVTAFVAACAGIPQFLNEVVPGPAVDGVQGTLQPPVGQQGGSITALKEGDAHQGWSWQRLLFDGGPGH